MATSNSTSTSTSDSAYDIEKNGTAVSVVADDDEAGVDYRTMTWIMTALFNIAETITLGTYGLSFASKYIGIWAFLFANTSIGLLVWFSGHQLYRFLLAHDGVYSFPDALGLVFGIAGQILGGFTFVLFLTSTSAAHILISGEMLSGISNSNMCSIGLTGFGAIIAFACTVSRRLKNTWYLSVLSILSFISAAILAIVANASAYDGSAEPYFFTPAEKTSTADIAQTICSILFTYMVPIAYPTLMSEMKKPEDFKYSLMLHAGVCITVSNVVVILLYNFAGEHIQSPALNSPDSVFRRTTYGVAFLTVVGGGVFAELVAAKYVYKQFWRIMRQPSMTMAKLWKSRCSWWTTNSLLVAIAFVVALSIPNFKQLLPLIGAMFGPWFCAGIPSTFFFWRNCSIEGLRGSWALAAREGQQVPMLIRVRASLSALFDRRRRTSEVPSRTTSQRQLLKDDGNGSLGSAERVSEEDATAAAANDEFGTLGHRIREMIRTKPLLTAVNTAIIILCVAISGLGMYGAIYDLATNPWVAKAFACMRTTNIEGE